MAVMDALGYLGVFVLFIVAEYVPFDGHLDVFNTIGQIFGFAQLAVYVLAGIYFFMFKRSVLYERGGNVKNVVDEGENTKELE